MNIRPFDFDKDYAEVSSWWTKQSWPVMPKNYLSASGFIAVDDENKYAVTWVFKTDSPFYIMEWLVGNPDVSFEKRKEGVDMVVESASEYSKSCGAKHLLTMTNNTRFCEKLKELKFTETDNNMVHFMRSL